MSYQKIKKLLKELEDELNEIKPATEEDIRLLLKIERDIDQLAKYRQQSNNATSQSFSFTEAAVHLEQSHPKAAAVLAQITQSLANLGI